MVAGCWWWTRPRWTTISNLTKPAWGPHRNGFRWGTASWGPRRLARSLADRAFGTLRWQLGYKTSWRGGQLIVADRFFPSSKTCSACGMVKAKLSLAERVFTCEGCGLVIDRDVNAARNLLVLAVSGTERVNACGAEVRPSVAGHTAMKQEPGAAQAGKTGTATGQLVAVGRVVTHDH